MTFHIISITDRRVPTDRAYHIRESFEAPTLVEACAIHASYRLGIRSYFLRDGTTGQRFSLEQSRHIVAAARQLEAA